jgi:protein TonB
MKKREKPVVKSKTLYFQIGLIIAMICAILFIEKTSVETRAVTDPSTLAAENLKMEPAPVLPKTRKEQPEKRKQKKEPKQKQKKSHRPPEIVDHEPAIEPPIFSKAKKIDGDKNSEPNFEPLKKGSIANVDPLSPGDVSQMPIFPGCENAEGREAREKCLQKNIARLIQRKFNRNIAEENGIEGIQSIYVSFVIDKDGKVGEIQTRSAAKVLEKETARVIGLIPQMTPAQQYSKNVPIRYAMPINFEIK